MNDLGDNGPGTGGGKLSPMTQNCGTGRTNRNLGSVDTYPVSPECNPESPAGNETPIGLSFALNNLVMSNVDVLESLLAMEDVVSGRILDSWCPYRFLPSVKEDEEKRKNVQPFRPYLVMRKRSGGFDAWCKSMRECSLAKLRAEQKRHKASENLYEEAAAGDNVATSQAQDQQQIPPPSPNKMKTAQQQQKQQKQSPNQQMQPPNNMMMNGSQIGSQMMMFNSVGAPVGGSARQMQPPMQMNSFGSPLYMSTGNAGFQLQQNVTMSYDGMDQYPMNQRRLSGGYAPGMFVDSVSPIDQNYVQQHAQYAPPPQFLQSMPSMPMDYSTQFRPRSGSDHGNHSVHSPDAFMSLNSNNNPRNTGDAYARRQQQQAFIDQQQLRRRPSSGNPTRQMSGSMAYYSGSMYN